jgi:1,4-alpha-glucan branching enzyme
MDEPIAPSPLPNQMGTFLSDVGCSFRTWAPHAAAVGVKVWMLSGQTEIVPMARDVSDGYGSGCWSVFVPHVQDGQHYRFVITYDGRDFERVDPFGHCVVYPRWSMATWDDSDARSEVASQEFNWGPPFQAPGWPELVIYQLHVGTFYDVNEQGPASLASIISKLDFLAWLGVNAVQLLPFTEFATEYSLGYNSMLPYAIERDYGRPEEVKRLVQACHDRGMRIIFDVIYNHIDIRVGPAEGPPKPYSLATYDGWRSGSNPDGIFFYGGDEISTPWGPRPDYGRPEVRRYLRDNALMWLEEFRADGLRFDSTKCIRLRQGSCGTFCCGEDVGDGQRNFGWELMQFVNNEIKARQPWKLTIAEDLDGNDWITKQTNEGGVGFDAQWDTGLRGALRNALEQPTDSGVNVEQVAAAIRASPGGNPFSRVIYLESHDEAKERRVPDAIFPGDAEGRIARKKTMLGTGIILTSPGIPMIFQGHEFLEWQQWSDKKPIRWEQKDRFPQYTLFYRDLIHLRTGTSGLYGPHVNVFQANPATKVLAYHRWNQGGEEDDVIIVANFSGQTYQQYVIGFPYAGTWRVCLNSDAPIYSDQDDFGAIHCADSIALSGSWDGMPYHGEVSIGPYSIVVFSR